MISEMRSAAAPTQGNHDPSWLIQRAWSVFRLPRLQELITATIAELRFGPCPDPSLVRDPSACAVAPDPAAEALLMCCDELREASGIPGADVERAQHIAMIRRYMRDEPLDWSEAFARALDAYRRAAAQAVQRTLARAHVA
jgi:hypothetical protein